MDHKEEIRRRIDVADLIGDSLELKPAGGGSMKAICPFHTEKTPSFYVSKEKQIWHCFGCGKGGDIFAFVMEMEGADFSEALRVLGKRAGVEIPRFSSTASNEKTRLLESNKQAESVFKHVLRSSDHGQHARSYVASRGYTDEIVDAFGIGFAPNEWSLLCDTLKKKGWKDHELVAAGLALNKKKGGGVVDRFRGRLMIPLRDHHGNTVGFTGRVLPGSDDSGPKYMNSPETLVYKKGELLFGLDRAKVAIKKEKQVVIVEGNLDVLASHMVGVEHVVASSGTALTQAQLHLLKRFTDTVVFCFDQDTAGFRAARKGIHLATELGFRVRVIQIPPGKGKDPDELIKQDAEAWKRLARHPIDIMEYYFQVAEAKNDLTDVQRKKRVGAFLLEEIARLPDVIEQEHWLRKLSPLVQVDVERLRGSLSKHNDGETPTAGDGPSHEAHKTKQEQARCIIVSAFLAFPEHRDHIHSLLAVLPDPERQAFLDDLQRMRSMDDPSDRAEIMQGEAFKRETSEDHIIDYIEGHVQVYVDEQNKQKRSAIHYAIRQAEEGGDNEKVEKLTREFQSYT